MLKCELLIDQKKFHFQTAVSLITHFWTTFSTSYIWKMLAETEKTKTE